VPRVATIEGPEALAAVAHPLRLRILERLREPASAATVARAVGQSRQNANYHLKELQRAGLVEPAGTRRNGNFVETLYRAVAGTIVVSPRAMWDDDRRARALRDQVSLERLVTLGERLTNDAVALLDAAAFDGTEIASASVEAEVTFATEADRAAFLDEYLEVVGPLLRKYGRRRRGSRYRVALAAYPAPEAERSPT
jgi:DNA-binding transcriptional ArsR family regulator